MRIDAGNDEIVFDLNRRQRRLRVADDETLLTTLRETFGLTSVRGTCGIGICGTCTVMVDGRVVSSCLMLTRQVAGCAVTTADGLVDGRRLDEVQQAFVDCGAYQCSFCIPAMTLAVRACLNEQPDATVETVREYLAGNLCRCGTYPQILEAAARLVGSASEAPPPDRDGAA
jgi:aerobic-type carbon monoxide dehydrogenase small subunit (CoxS/CutS family)